MDNKPDITLSTSLYLQDTTLLLTLKADDFYLGITLGKQEGNFLLKTKDNTAFGSSSISPDDFQKIKKFFTKD